MKLTPFKAVYPDLDKVEDHDDFFGSVKQDFPIMAANTMFLQDDDECLYLYDIVTTKMIHSGLVGCVSVSMTISTVVSCAMSIRSLHANNA